MRFTLAAVASLLVLLVLNTLVFPLVFPSGVALKYASPRSQPLVLLHLAALVVTAVLLTVLGAVVRPAGSSSGAAGFGGIAGLLGSLPSALHTQALAHVAVSELVAPVIWTSVTWSVAAAVAHWAYRWRTVRGD